jgi:hypothetical protein
VLRGELDERGELVALPFCGVIADFSQGWPSTRWMMRKVVWSLPKL